LSEYDNEYDEDWDWEEKNEEEETIDPIDMVRIPVTYEEGVHAWKKLKKEGDIARLSIEELSALVRLISYLRRSGDNRKKQLGEEMDRELSNMITTEKIKEIRRRRPQLA
jgi:hypothetical protein